MSSPVPSPSWNTVRYTATYRNYDGTLRTGTFKASINARVTNPPEDSIFPLGLWQQGTLNVDSGALDGKSLDIRLPAVDDPDIGEHNWFVTLEVNPSNATKEVYELQPPVALAGDPIGIDLVDITLPQVLPPPTPVIIKGIPNGYAGLDDDGDVVDADGTKVLPGGGTAGKGIQTAEIDTGTGHLIFTYTDASSDDVGKVVGDDGPPGADGQDNTMIVASYEDVTTIPPYGTQIVRATI